MRFVKAKDLKKGMRLGKPIFNKNGVLLYDRDTLLTNQGINSINNFKLIGIYILEPAEPLAPMTEDDREFEKFQTMSVFSLKEDLELMQQGKSIKNLNKLVNLIDVKYGKMNNKIIFQQNLRSYEDYVFKHSLNTAILAALMCSVMKLSKTDRQDTIMAALIHDLGDMQIPEELFEKGSSLSDKADIVALAEYRSAGYQKIMNDTNISAGVRSIIAQKYKFGNSIESGNPDNAFKYTKASRILYIAEFFDKMTAMKVDDEPDSDVVVTRYLMAEKDRYSEEVVSALVNCVKILYPGVCVELSNGQTGLVIKGNDTDILRPIVLQFENNKIVDLSDEEVFKTIQIRDVMKTMDKRIKIDQKTIDEYMEKYSKLV